MTEPNLVHFHDGPHHGSMTVLPDDVATLPVYHGDNLVGTYVRDPGSAGGHCMDWEPDYPFQEITAPLNSNSEAITKGPEIVT